jgi:hypothetical protein
VDREAGFLEHFANQPFRDELVVLDNSSGKSPERLLGRSTLQDKRDLVPAADDRRRDLVRGTRTHKMGYDAAARTPARARERSSAAAANSRKSGAGRVGRDLNSGWNWLATNQG